MRILWDPSDLRGCLCDILQRIFRKKTCGFVSDRVPKNAFRARHPPLFKVQRTSTCSKYPPVTQNDDSTPLPHHRAQRYQMWWCKMRSWDVVVCPVVVCCVMWRCVIWWCVMWWCVMWYLGVWCGDGAQQACWLTQMCARNLVLFIMGDGHPIS